MTKARPCIGVLTCRSSTGWEARIQQGPKALIGKTVLLSDNLIRGVTLQANRPPILDHDQTPSLDHVTAWQTIVVMVPNLSPLARQDALHWGLHPIQEARVSLRRHRKVAA